MANAAVLLLSVTLSGPARGQAPTEEDRARQAHAFSSSVMSPFCPGRTLTDCPSPSAGALRDEIRALLASGMDEETLRVELRRRYGDVVMAEPTGAWGWVLPILVLGVGLGGLALALSRLSQGAPVGKPGIPATAQMDGLEAELDRDLSERGL